MGGHQRPRTQHRLRLDYFFVSPDLPDRIAKAATHPIVTGHDYCPAYLALDV
jgi:exonuclease III